MNKRNKIIFLISLSVIGFIFQLHFQTKGYSLYNTFLSTFTINPSSGILGFIGNNFLHANAIHIGLNMFFLYMLLSMYSNRDKILTIYFLSALFSSLFSLLYIHFISEAYVLGASGAIFGIFSYIYFKENKKNEFYLNFAIVNIGMVLLGMNIAWYAHLGGAIAGILYYYYENDIMPNIKRKRLKRI